MIITSSAFDDGSMIPRKFTCDGGDMNPELLIQNVPAEAQSLALILHDPDAPIPGGFTHWTVWNINTSTTSIAENSVPAGAIQGQTSFGQNLYGGPCPPAGSPHHYRFTIYALDSKLTLPSYSQAADLTTAMQSHILDQAELVGLYGRSK